MKRYLLFIGCLAIVVGSVSSIFYDVGKIAGFEAAVKNMEDQI